MIIHSALKRSLPMVPAMAVLALSGGASSQALAAQNASGTASVEGTVVRAGSGQPLEGVTVSLNAVSSDPVAREDEATDPRTLIRNRLSDSASVTTNRMGRFLIVGIEPGQYEISAERDGYIRMEYGQRTWNGSGIPVALEAGQQLMLGFQMTPGGIISGRATGASGEPFFQASIHAYTYQYSNGGRYLTEVATTETNDLGEYRLAWLDPGDYLVSATSPEIASEEPTGYLDLAERAAAAEPRAADLAALLASLGGRGEPASRILTDAIADADSVEVYYPGTTDPGAAALLQVSPAAELSGVNFQLRRVPTLSVRGRVAAQFPLPNPATGPGGGRGRGAARRQRGIEAALVGRGRGVQVRLTRSGAAPGGIGLLAEALGATEANADGTFEISGVAPGSYLLSAVATSPDGVAHTGAMSVVVESRDVDNLVLSLSPPTQVSGRVSLDPAFPSGIDLTRIRVSLVAEGSVLARGGGSVLAGLADAGLGLPASQGASSGVAEDGTLTLRNVAAVEHRIRVTGLPTGAYIRSGRMGPVDVMNGPFAIPGSGSVIELAVGFSTSQVTGTVMDNGQPYPAAAAVLVPDETRRGRADLYFPTTTDSSGRFVFTGVPPGSYKIFAWDDVPSGAYQYADFLRSFESRGHAITVGDNTIANVELEVIHR